MTTLQTNKGKVLIFILSLVALVFTSIGSMTNFLSFGFGFDVYFRFPDATTLISMELGFLPLLALVVYALIFYKKNKAPILVTIIWGLYAFTIFFNFMTNILQFNPGTSYVLTTLLELSVCVLAAIFATKKLGKIFGIIASAVLILQTFSGTISMITDIIKYNLPADYSIFYFFSTTGFYAFIAAMLLISLLRKTDAAVPAAPETPVLPETPAL